MQIIYFEFSRYANVSCVHIYYSPYQKPKEKFIVHKLDDGQSKTDPQLFNLPKRHLFNLIFVDIEFAK